MEINDSLFKKKKKLMYDCTTTGENHGSAFLQVPYQTKLIFVN